MRKEGKYVYCIVKADNDFNFGPIGIGNRGDLVTTIGLDELCMVVSNHPLDKFTVNPENILAHQRVIEEVMKEFTSVLPLRFGTIAAAPDEIRNLLNRRSREFLELLYNYNNTFEANVTCTWKNMDEIYREIKEDNEVLKKLERECKREKDTQVRQKKMKEAGIIVEKDLMEKKNKEAHEILMAFKKVVVDYCHNKTSDDATFFNTAFLVRRVREKELDNIVADLGEKYLSRIDIRYTSPLPIFNFINLTIFPEKWET